MSGFCSTEFSEVRLSQRGKDRKAACFSVVVPKVSERSVAPDIGSARQKPQVESEAVDRPKPGDASAAGGASVNGRSATDEDGVCMEETEMEPEVVVAMGREKNR